MDKITPKASSLSELIWQASETTPNDTFVMEPQYKGEGLITWTQHTFSQVATLVSKYKDTLKNPPFELHQGTVVGIMSYNNLSYIALALACWDLGCTVFTINTRLSDEVLAELLSTSETKLLLVPEGPLLKRTVSHLKPKLPYLKYGVFDSTSSSFNEESVFVLRPSENTKISKDLLSKSSDVAIIMHTSGTTKTPKLVPLTHYNYLHTMEAQSRLSRLDRKEYTISFLPFFHLMGINQLLATLYRQGRYVFAYMPDHIPSAEHILLTLKNSEASYLSSVPYILQEMVNLGEKDPQVFDTLKKLKFVSTGGVQLPLSLGEALSSKGIALSQGYGMTEAGIVMMGIPGKQWRYLRIIPGTGATMRLQPGEKNVYELVVVNNPGCTSGYLKNPNASKELYPVPGELHTKDLFEEVEPGLYHYIGRKDDLYVHTTGEKTNPVAMETISDNHPYVKKSVLVGHNRPFNVLLIQLRQDKIQSVPLEDVKAEVLKHVDVMNKQAAEYSRVLPKNVIFLEKDQEFPLATKGSVIRPHVLDLFKDKINKIYLDSELDKIDVLPSDTVATKVGKIMQKVFGNTLANDANLLDHGLDSLSAVQLQTAFSSIFALPSQHFSPTLVYKFPVVSDLITYTEELLQMNPEERLAHHKLLSSIDQYDIMGKNLPESIKNALTKGNLTHVPATSGAILLTGARGFLGNYILADLLNLCPNTIYCAVRPHGNADEGHLRAQLYESLQQRKIAYNLEKFNERVKVLVGDVNEPLLGLTESKYQALCREVTSIIHCAWEPNLTAPFPVQQVHLKGTQTLLELATTHSLKEFNFVSSVSAHFRHPSGVIPEEASSTIQDAMPIGYGISKWIAEQWVHQASLLGLKTRTFIVGYISGSTDTGSWNRTDSLPRILQASMEQNLFPEEFGLVNWIPVNVAGSVVTSLSLKGQTGVYHVVTPFTYPWSFVLSNLKKEYPSMKVVSTEDWWKHQFEVSNSNVLPLFSWIQQSKEATKGSAPKTFDTKKTSEALHGNHVTLENCKLTDQVLQKYWSYLKEGTKK
eukprot:TRINITY_DN20823_c0_g1_i1.p1 TRINITY_DN20823_c0_g1~~TRINITY_DN20823_c0_g1_i1.p1  ORF type:complete len:1052 (-),score=200.58 TRINITY_DN20823_c0_g1_i1:5-3118(-)